MFQSARVKLTIWYVAILMAISICFSVVIYHLLTAEIIRFEHRFRMRQEVQLRQRFFLAPLCPPEPTTIADWELLNEWERRIRLSLIFLNVGIFTCATVASYVLAGKTLKPIKDMMDEQKRFLSDASHELRTPLTAMKSELEVQLRDTRLTAKEARQTLTSTLEEVDILHRLTEKLLTITSYQSQQRTFQFEEVDMKDIIQSAHKRVRHMFENKHVSFRLPKTSVYTYGDASALTDLVVILLDNAIKYSFEDGVVDIHLKSTDTKVIFSIHNHGIGIENHDMPHIFDRFYRADTARTKHVASTGYGLGLSIAKTIVEAHKGSIQAHSTKKDGTTFSVSLPNNP